MKNILLSSTTALILLLTGCSDTETCQFEVQQNLDKSNFAAVIGTLENDSSCINSYPNNDHLISLGTAYLGKAGLSFTDIIDSLTVAADNQNTAFAAFIDATGEKTTIDSQADLKTATDIFKTYLGDETCIGLNLPVNNDKLYAQKDVCLFMAFSETLRATNAITLLTDDLTGWLDPNTEVKVDENKNDVPDDLDASACSIQYAASGPTIPCLPANGVNTDVTQKGVISFDNNSTYEMIDVTIGANSYTKLIFPSTVAIGRSPILTSGFCTTSFDKNVCDQTTGATSTEAACLPCPTNTTQGSENTSATTVLVDSLNTGLDIAALSVNNELLEQTLNDFNKEVKKDGTNTEITSDDIVNYLQTSQTK